MTLQMLGALKSPSTMGTHSEVASTATIVTHSLSLVWRRVVVGSHGVTDCWRLQELERIENESYGIWGNGQFILESYQAGLALE